MTEFNKQPKPELTDKSKPVWPKVVKALNSVRQDFNLTKSEFDELSQIMEERNQFGIEKYGVPLSSFNGRDPLQDAFEEALDLVVYSSQSYMENKNKKHAKMLEELVESALNSLIVCFRALKAVEKKNG
jgi:hypothetical protein